MTDDLDSTQKGIWILPYEPDPSSEPDMEAGPSRPLKRVYEQSMQTYRDAHEAYESQRTEEQLDDIADWLERCASTDKGKGVGSRLPVGILQHAGKKLHTLLPSAAERADIVNLQGRDVADLASAMRAIVSSLIPQAPGKSGLTALDQVEQRWQARKDRAGRAILLHIRDAQVVPTTVLAEVMYCLTTHPDLPFRLLLSVPSTRTFLSQWSTLEPSSIDLTVLSAARGHTKRRQQNSLRSILETAGRTAPLCATGELVDKLQQDEAMFGEGPDGALKQLHWSMLHHEHNNPLSAISQDDTEAVRAVQAIVDALKTDPSADVPGKEMLQVPLTTDLAHVNDPSPRISILHAMANPSSYTPRVASATTPKSSRKQQDAEETAVDHLKELEALYGLWKGAGKSVNLWDWLQGFQGSLANAVGVDDDGKEGEEEEGEGKSPSPSCKRPREHTEQNQNQDQDRSHAAFVRFCEEARMMGLVRAKGRKADEVVKSVTLV